MFSNIDQEVFNGSSIVPFAAKIFAQSANMKSLYSINYKFRVHISNVQKIYLSPYEAFIHIIPPLPLLIVNFKEHTLLNLMQYSYQIS
ncbi:MAG: hypothetical protein H6Q69_3677 [Firmicutes bacterium]|nr:hypothetical protein [Bacillota bacterium]